MTEEAPEAQPTPPKKYGPGRPRKGEVRPSKVPKPATPEEAKQNAKKLAAQVARAVWEGKDGLPKGDSRWLVNPMSITMAHLKHIIGEDPERFKVELAHELLGTAVMIRRKIEEKLEADELPASTLGFIMSVCVDKAEALMTKVASSAKGAQVGTQINIFGDGTVSRDEIMRQLQGNFRPEEPKPVEPIPVETSPVPS